MAHAHARHHHHHHGHSESASHKLTIATIANVVVVAAELTVGFYAGSLALIGDALHNLTDAFALIIALIAVRLERRPATTEKSFGYQRAGILAAFINAGMLAVFTAYLFKEAFERIRHPHAVDDVLMIIAASVALLVNSGTAISLRREGRHDVNIRGAVVHMIADAASSAGIIVAAILIRLTGSTRWDAVVTMIIGLLILWSSWGILRETVNLLLEGTPEAINPEAVTSAINGVEGVYGVHHLHIWALGPSSPALSCHVMVGDVPLKTTKTLLDQITEMLEREHGIVHATIQFEYAECAEGDLYCVPWSVKSGAPLPSTAPRAEEGR